MSALRCLLLAATAFALLESQPAIADDSSVSFDAGVDFKALKTFAIRGGRLHSNKPEIDNRLFRQRMEDSIRLALAKKGLTEAASDSDVVVTYHFDDKDVSAVDRRGPIRVRGSRGNPGFVIPTTGPVPVLYTEGTLVIDITNAAQSLLWRGTSRDEERNGPKLSRKLSGDARKLLAKYPPVRR